MARLPLQFRPGGAVNERLRVHIATTGPEPGNWLISIDGPRCQVFPGGVHDPDARVYTASDIGHQILGGITSLAEAIAGRLVDFDGDRYALRRLAASFGWEAGL
jgi:hypothetical protein